MAKAFSHRCCSHSIANRSVLKMKQLRNRASGITVILMWICVGLLTVYFVWRTEMFDFGTTRNDVVPENVDKLKQQVAFLQKSLSNVVARTEQLSCSLQKIGSRGGFCLTPQAMEVGGNWEWDLNVAIQLENLMQNKRVGDFGAGLGWYGRYLQRTKEFYFPTARALEMKQFFDLPAVQKAMETPKKISSWKGYDGAVYVEELTGGLVQFLDLSEPVLLPEKYDWIISLEVGEHIPPAFEKNFLDNLARHACEGIVLSWAVPDQGGHHHVNNHNASYVKQKLKERGFVDDLDWEKRLKNAATLRWFKDTLMVFFRSERSSDVDCRF